jgi:hypothetical protein
VHGARYNVISILGKRVTLVTPHSVDAHGAGVRLSRPFLGKPKSAIRQTITGFIRAHPTERYSSLSPELFNAR